MNIKTYLLGIVLVWLMSCTEKEASLHDKLVGEWLPCPVNEIDSALFSFRIYYPDSTFYAFHGDYHDDGVFWVEDSVLNSVSTYSSDTIRFKILTLTDSIVELKSVETDFFTTHYKVKL